MTSLDSGMAAFRSAIERLSDLTAVRLTRTAFGQVQDGWRRIARWLNSVMPKGLYARALLIIIAPMVILQLSLIHI